MEADHLGKLRVATDGGWRDVWEMPQFDFIGADFGAPRLEAFLLQTQDFVDCLREGRPPAVTGEDGRAAIEMVEAANLSSLTGGVVSLPLPRAKGGFQFDAATVSRDRIPG
jgi:predicted dehydrogenase